MFCGCSSDAVAGHDVNDSTTVADKFEPIKLDGDSFSVKDIHVGIPKVMLQSVNEWVYVCVNQNQNQNFICVNPF